LGCYLRNGNNGKANKNRENNEGQFKFKTDGMLYKLEHSK
jgi:hypothetical protein